MATIQQEANDLRDTLNRQMAAQSRIKSRSLNERQVMEIEDKLLTFQRQVQTLNLKVGL